MNNFSFSPKGWECPKCGRVYSPTTPICMHCSKQVTSGTTINTPIINATGTYSYHNFFSDNNGTAPKCAICGLESWQHSVVIKNKQTMEQQHEFMLGESGGETAVNWLLYELQDQFPKELSQMNDSIFEAIFKKARQIEQQLLKEMYLRGIENYDPTFKRK